MKNTLIILFTSCLAAVASALTVEVVPTFASASIYLHDAESDEHTVRYRAAGSDTWLDAVPLVSTENNPAARLSLMGLQEDTEYEVRVLAGDQPVGTTQFRTLSEKVPVAKTIVLDSVPAVIRENGTADGWIRYVAKEPLVAPDGSPIAIHVVRSSYILLEGITVSGGDDHGIVLDNSEHVRVVNCDISGWGHTSDPNYLRHGRSYDSEGKLINNLAAVYIRESGNVVVEHCYMHDPVGCSNSWAFAHPSGPNAIYVNAAGNTIVRYNDMVGSDQHRWNDVIEGYYNGKPEGGFHRDADIYGNVFLYGNDDAIELDGGQMNVRFWGNWIEGTFAGVSTAPSFYGPSYIYNNVTLNLGDNLGLSGSTLKNNYRQMEEGSIFYFNNTSLSGKGISGFGKEKGVLPQVRVFNNVMDLQGSTYSWWMIENGRVENNVIWPEDGSYREYLVELLEASSGGNQDVVEKPVFEDPSTGDYRLAADSPGVSVGKQVSGFPYPGTTPGIWGVLPLRPTSLSLSTARVDLTRETTATVTVSLEEGAPQSFRILKNTAFDWFTVESDAAELVGGEKVQLTVTLTEEPTRAGLRGAFLVKLEDGNSRPVIVTAGEREGYLLTEDLPGVVEIAEAEDFQNANLFQKSSYSGASARRVLILPESTNRELDRDKVMSYTFQIPADGIYYLAARYLAQVPSGSHNSFYLSLDGKEFTRVDMRGTDAWSLAGISPHKGRRGYYEPLELKEGLFTVFVSPREGLILDSLILVETPVALYRTELERARYE